MISISDLFGDGAELLPPEPEEAQEEPQRSKPEKKKKRRKSAPETQEQPLSADLKPGESATLEELKQRREEDEEPTGKVIEELNAKRDSGEIPLVYEDEAEIVWLEPHEHFDYLRETRYPFSGPTRKPSWNGHDGRLIGYATVKSNPTRARIYGGYIRRAWWVRETDPYPDGGHPCEAVHPLSVRAGYKSLRPYQVEEGNTE